MISDEQIEAALDYLAKNVEASAKARAEKIYMVEYRKTVKAELMNKCNESTEGARERFAYSHEDYKEHLDAMRTAIEIDAKCEFRRAAYNATIEAWRTQQANERTIGKIG